MRVVAHKHDPNQFVGVGDKKATPNFTTSVYFRHYYPTTGLYQLVGFFVLRPTFKKERVSMATQKFRELIDVAPVPAGQPVLQYKTMSGLLSDFRKHIEREAGQPCQEIEAPVAMVLFDLCEYLRLSDDLTLKVLGASADRWIRCQLDGQPKIKINLH